MPDHVQSQPGKSRPDSKPVLTEKAANAQFPAVRLQSMIGNQATQRLLQREGWSFNPVQGPPSSALPNLGGVQSKDMARTQPVYDYLNQHKANLVLSPSVLHMARQVRLNVPAAADIGAGELQTIITTWAQSNNIAVTTPPAGASATTAQVGNAAEAGLSVSASTKVGKDAEGRLSLSMSGATAAISRRAGTEGAKVTVSPGGVEAETKGGGVTVSSKIGWDNVGFKVEKGDLKFSAKVDEKRWELEFSYGKDQAPDLSKIAEIFRTGEASMRRSLSGIAAAKGPEDIQPAISENLTGVKEAVSAVSDIGSIQPGSFSASLKISGPGANPDRNDPAATATTVAAVVTFTF